MRAEERSTAIELEIEITMIGCGLGEKFHATILPNLIKIFCPNAADVSVLDLENTMNAFGVVEQARRSCGTMIASFRAEVGYVQRFRSRPGVIVPVRLHRRGGGCGINQVMEGQFMFRVMG